MGDGETGETGERIANNQQPTAKLMNSTTLATAFELKGTGLHSGILTAVKVKPARSESGRYFVRVDLPEMPSIPAKIEAVSETTLSTELAAEGAKIRTVEHLLAALFGSGVANARIEIDGPEIPLLDGSAQNWLEAIAAAGVVGDTQMSLPSLKEPVIVREGDAFVAAIPAARLRFSYGIDFACSAIGKQWHSFDFSPDNFAAEIAPARTFGLAEQVEQLRAAGLIKGGTLENALVASDRGWLNPPLRFANEPARHKLLDLVGDLSLLGSALPVAHYLAYKASHKLHVKLAKTISNSIVHPR